MALCERDLNASKNKWGPDSRSLDISSPGIRYCIGQLGFKLREPANAKSSLKVPKRCSLTQTRNSSKTHTQISPMAINQQATPPVYSFHISSSNLQTRPGDSQVRSLGPPDQKKRIGSPRGSASQTQPGG